MEGMTELVFVYYCIRAYFNADWTAFHMDFVSVSPYGKIDLPHPYGDENAEYHFLLYNCGSDDSVLPTMNDRLLSHIQQGFCRVIGLRDIYGSRYFDVYKAGHQEIEWRKVKMMMDDLESTVAELDTSGTMSIRFSIMEIEAWVLAMPDLLHEVFADFPYDRLASVDPEVSYVHPSKELCDLIPYEKHFDSVAGFFSLISRAHMEALLQSGKCASFVRFYESLFC